MKALSTAVLAALTLGGGAGPTQSPPASAPAQAAQATGFKIAYVDIEQVFNAVPSRAAAESTFNKKGEELQASVVKLGDSLQKEIQRFNNDDAKLNANPLEKSKRDKALQDLNLEFQKKKDGATQSLQKLNDELMAPIKEIVKSALDEIREKDGYALILANDPLNPLVVAGDKNLDVTEKAMLRVKAKPNQPVKRPGGK